MTDGSSFNSEHSPSHFMSTSETSVVISPTPTSSINIDNSSIVGYKGPLKFNESDTIPSSGVYASHLMLIFTGEDHKLTNGTLQSIEVCLRNETRGRLLALFVLQNTSTHYTVEAVFYIAMTSTADHCVNDSVTQICVKLFPLQPPVTVSENHVLGFRFYGGTQLIYFPGGPQIPVIYIPLAFHVNFAVGDTLRHGLFSLSSLEPEICLRLYLGKLHVSVNYGVPIFIFFFQKSHHYHLLTCGLSHKQPPLCHPQLS